MEQVGTSVKFASVGQIAIFRNISIFVFISSLCLLWNTLCRRRNGGGVCIQLQESWGSGKISLSGGPDATHSSKLLHQQCTTACGLCGTQICNVLERDESLK
jgi:hypothetical protein